MKAVRINQYGSSQELQVTDAMMPAYDTHDVLIQVYATGINPLDTKVRVGDLKLLMDGNFPKTLGAECAGVVEAVGLMITDLQPGDRVVASLGPTGGGYAQYAVAKRKNVIKIPDEVTFDQAAALPVAALTALQALRDKGHLRPDDKVLINGAAGGVGTFAVQFARLLGGYVTAVCSAENAQLVRELGAHTVIDYNAVDFTAQAEQYNLIFDAVGKLTYEKCRNVLTEKGIYVTTMPTPRQVFDQVVSIFTDQKAESIMTSFSEEDMDWVLKQLVQQRIRVVIDRTYTLDQLSQAHAYSETGRVKGKLILEVVKESPASKPD